MENEEEGIENGKLRIENEDTENPNSQFSTLNSQFRDRSRDLERLDTGDYTPEEYAKWHREMRFVHGIFGEMRALKRSMFRDASAKNETRISVLDVGAGSGGLLRAVKKWTTGIDAFLVGAELNAEAARTISENGLLAIRADALRLPFADDSFDYVYCSLFLHHLDDLAAIEMVREMSRVARRKFYVIDLHRHAVAYYLYWIFSRIFLQRFTHEDGSLSILRSFKPDELRRLGADVGIDEVKVERSLAFRLVLSGKKRVNRS